MAYARPAAQPVHKDGFYRTPAQMFWLGLVTFGVYQTYYLIRGRRLARRRLGWTEETYWTGFKLIIPIYGLFYFFASWAEVGDRVKASGIKLWLPLSVQMIPFILSGFLWRLPDTIWTPLFMLGAIGFGTAGISVAQAERADEPGYVWPRLSIAEWIVGIACTLFFGFVLVGLFIDDVTSAVDWTSVMVYAAVAIVAFAVFQMKYGSLSRARADVPDASTGSA